MGCGSPGPWSQEIWRDYNKKFTQQIHDWLDAGRGECWLKRADVRSEVVCCLKKFDGIRLHLGDFVIMPNHVHLLITPKEGVSLAALMKGIKGASARACNKLLGRVGTFWMEESYDHLVRDREQWEAFRRYIASNPKKAGLSDDEFTLYEASAGEMRTTE